jgi:L-threonylcarbamoyladenylate synthase
MKYRHYAPKAELIVVEGETNRIVEEIKKLIDEYSKMGKKVGVMATDETIENYKAGIVKSVGSRLDLSTIARNLFRILREFDDEGVEVILAEGVPEEGLGLAIMNRLRKASGYKIIHAN